MQALPGMIFFFDWKMVQKLEHRYTLKQLVFIMNTTDINDVMIRGGNERFCSNGLLNYHSQPWWEPIYAVSYVFRLFVHNVLKRDYNLFSAAEQNKKHYLALNKMSTLISTEIVPWAVKRKVQLQFVVLPMRYELEAPNTYYHDLIHMLGGVNQINILNCLPRLKAEENLNAVYWTRDLHFTPQGYSIIANTLIDSCYR
jgi:hypothetical protein